MSFPYFTTKTSDFNYYKVIGSDADFIKKYGIHRVMDTLINVLNTKRGSFPGDPNHGSILHTFVFDQTDEFTKMDIEQEIRYIAAVYTPEAKITNIQIYNLPDNKGFKASIYLDYQGQLEDFDIEVKK